MEQDARSISAATAEAFVKTNTILLTDTQDAVPWRMAAALGEEKVPPVDRLTAGILAGAYSTQKERDLLRNNKLRLNTFTSEAASFFVNILKRQAPGSTIADVSKPAIFPQKFLPALIQIQAGKELDPDIDKEVSNYTKDLRYHDDLEQQGLVGIIRLQRDGIATTLSFVKKLRHLGFDLFPGFTNSQLIQKAEGVLKAYNELYPKAAEYGLRFDSTGNVFTLIDLFQARYLEMSPQQGFDLAEFTNKMLDEYKAMMKRDSEQPPVTQNGY